MTVRDFAKELRMGAWQTADGESIFDGTDAPEFGISWDSHERQDAAYDVEHGHAAYMLSCGHALPRWSAERLRVTGNERFCGICQAYVEKA